MKKLLNGNKTVKMTSLGVLFTAVFLVFGIVCILTNTEKCIAGSNEDKYFTNVTVEEGDTLWDLASEYMDENHYESIYEYIDELKHMNNMTSEDIFAGQNLVVTYYKTLDN